MGGADTILENYGLVPEDYLHEGRRFKWDKPSFWVYYQLRDLHTTEGVDHLGIERGEYFDVYSQIDTTIVFNKWSRYIEQVNHSDWFKKHAYRNPYECFKFSAGLEFIMKQISRLIDAEKMGVIEFYEYKRLRIKSNWLDMWVYWVVERDSYNNPHHYKKVKFIDYDEVKEFNRGYKYPKRHWGFHRQDFVLDDPDEYSEEYAHYFD